MEEEIGSGDALAQSANQAACAAMQMTGSATPAIYLVGYNYEGYSRVWIPRIGDREFNYEGLVPAIGHDFWRKG